MRRIDLSCKLLAPMFSGIILQHAGTFNTTITIALWNVVGFFFELGLLYLVYRSIRPLATKKLRKQLYVGERNEEEEVELELREERGGREEEKEEGVGRGGKEGEASEVGEGDLGEGQLAFEEESNELEADFDEHNLMDRTRRRHHGRSVSGFVSTHIKSPFLSIWKGWGIYMRQEIALAGLALATIYLTVLGFSGVTATYFLLQGLRKDLIGVAQGVGALWGISGTLAYPYIRGRNGTVRAGIFGISFQYIFLLLCGIAVIIPGQRVANSAESYYAADCPADSTCDADSSGVPGSVVLTTSNNFPTSVFFASSPTPNSMSITSLSSSAITSSLSSTSTQSYSSVSASSSAFPTPSMSPSLSSTSIPSSSIFSSPAFPSAMSTTSSVAPLLSSTSTPRSSNSASIVFTTPASPSTPTTPSMSPSNPPTSPNVPTPTSSIGSGSGSGDIGSGIGSGGDWSPQVQPSRVPNYGLFDRDTLNDTTSSPLASCTPTSDDEGRGNSVGAPLILMLIGVLGARFGLWIFDLSIQQLVQERVAEENRGVVGGVMNAMNSIMDMLHYVLVIAAPRPENFNILVFISLLAVGTGWVLYASYVRKIRGHFFHTQACRRKLRQLVSGRSRHWRVPSESDEKTTLNEEVEL